MSEERKGFYSKDICTLIWLSFSPLARIRVRSTSLRRLSCSSLVDPNTMMSSWELAHPGRSAMIDAVSAWNTSLAECIPNGRRLKQNRPNEVPKVSKSALSSSTFICQYPDTVSSFEKYWVPDILEIISSVDSCRWYCRFMALLRGRRSKHIVSLPFGLETITRALTHSVCFSTGSMILRSTMRCSSSLSFGFSLLEQILLFLQQRPPACSFTCIIFYFDTSMWRWQNSSLIYLFDQVQFTQVFNPRMGTESDSPTMKRIRMVWPLCLIQAIHLPAIDVPL